MARKTKLFVNRNRIFQEIDEPFVVSHRVGETFPKFPPLFLKNHKGDSLRLKVPAHTCSRLEARVKRTLAVQSCYRPRRTTNALRSFLKRSSAVAIPCSACFALR